MAECLVWSNFMTSTSPGCFSIWTWPCRKCRLSAASFFSRSSSRYHSLRVWWHFSVSLLDRWRSQATLSMTYRNKFVDTCSASLSTRPLPSASHVAATVRPLERRENRLRRQVPKLAPIPATDCLQHDTYSSSIARSVTNATCVSFGEPNYGVWRNTVLEFEVKQVQSIALPQPVKQRN